MILRGSTAGKRRSKMIAYAEKTVRIEEYAHNEDQKWIQEQKNTMRLLGKYQT